MKRAGQLSPEDMRALVSVKYIESCANKKEFEWEESQKYSQSLREIIAYVKKQLGNNS